MLRQGELHAIVRASLIGAKVAIFRCSALLEKRGRQEDDVAARPYIAEYHIRYLQKPVRYTVVLLQSEANLVFRVSMSVPTSSHPRLSLTPLPS